MQRDKPLEILVIIVILGGLAWGGKQLYSISGTLQGMETKVSTTDARVNRIASVLPDIGIRIASEEIRKPIQSAIVSTKPFKKPDGNWAMKVHVLDIENEKKVVYTCSLSDKNDNKCAYMVLGVGSNLEPRLSSAREMVGWCTAIKEPTAFPNFVNQSATMGFHDTSAKDLNSELYKLGPSEESTFKNPPANSKALIKIIKEKQKEFEQD